MPTWAYHLLPGLVLGLGMGWHMLHYLADIQDLPGEDMNNNYTRVEQVQELAQVPALELEMTSLYYLRRESIKPIKNTPATKNMTM